MTLSVLNRTVRGLGLFELFHGELATIFVRGDVLCVELSRKGDIYSVNNQLEKLGWEWLENTNMWFIRLGQGPL